MLFANLEDMADQSHEGMILHSSTDEDATPRPLRVVKRDCSRPGASTHFNSEKSESDPAHLFSDLDRTGIRASSSDKEPTLSLSKGKKSTIPARTSSISQSRKGSATKPRRRYNRTNNTDAECVSPSPSNARTLRVRKSRKSDIRNSDSDTRILSSEDHSPTDLLQYQTTRNPTYFHPLPLATTVCSIPSSTDGRVDPNLGGASTWADLSRPDYSKPTDKIRGSSMSLSFTPLVKYDHRRIQSADSYKSSTSDLIQPHKVQLAENTLADRSQQHYQSRGSSYTQRIFNKLTSHFPSRTFVAQAGTERKGCCKKSPLRLHSSKENKISGRKARSRATTVSSVETLSSFNSGLDGTIAAFPKQSVVTSATTVNSLDLGFRVAIPTILSSINDTSVVGASLTLIPEVDTVDTFGGKTLFVAIDIEGIMNTPPLTFGSRLNVVVIIDNSIYTSPAALMTSCETTTFIASLLDPRRDRFALLCTHSCVQNQGPSELSPMLPLSIINTRQIRKTVDVIVGCTDKPDSTRIINVIELAYKVLLQATSDDAPNGHTETTYGQIIVLTCNPCSFSGCDKAEDKIQAHVVCPGFFPWKNLDPERFNGWHLSSSSWQDDDFTLEAGLRKRLRKWIAQVRHEASYGALTDVALIIKAGPHCSIEGIMGKCIFPNLQPGELHTTLVKVKVNEIPVDSLALSNFPQGPKTFSGSIDLLKELDVLLIDAPVPIMTAKLKYKHSLLPPNTQSSIKYEVRLKREFPESPRKLQSAKATSAEKASCGRSLPAVQKRLVHHLTTHQTPPNALHTLQEEFGVDGSRSVCQDYIKEIINELKYQARVIERFNLHDYEPIEEMELDMRTISLSNSDTSCYAERENWIPTEEGFLSPGRIVNHEGELRRERISSTKGVSDDGVDEAHRIWTEIRRRSKSGRPTEWMAAREASMGQIPEEKLRQIQEVALKNKRSVGADTLMSISQAGRSSGSFAPWL